MIFRRGFTATDERRFPTSIVGTQRSGASISCDFAVKLMEVNLTEVKLTKEGLLERDGNAAGF
ncbi:MAG: hypothetical protein C0478_01940 [Planctomyces sp.]|nr:hypothetical protein [Planctomyces sp.]